MNNHLLFKTICLFVGLLLVNRSLAQPNCVGQMALKSNTRDWVKDFDKIAKGRVAISPLKAYFYDITTNKKRDCISLVELKALATALNQLDTKNNAEAKRFVAAVSAIAKANPPGNAAPGTKPATTTTTTGQAGEQTFAPDSTDNEVIANLHNQLSTAKETGDFWQMVAFGLAGLLTLVIGAAVWLQFRTDQDIKRQRERHRREMSDLEVGHNARLDNLQRKLEGNSNTRFEEKYTSSRSTDRPNQATLTNKANPLKAPEPTAKPDAAPKPVEANTNSMPLTLPPFYLSIPTAGDDGTTTFLDRRQTQFNASSSVYRLQLTGNTGEKAQFWFVNEPSLVEGALSYPDTYLRPACDYKSLNTKAKQIITDKPGIAVLIGEVWRVERKAEIRFV